MYRCKKKKPHKCGGKLWQLLAWWRLQDAVEVAIKQYYLCMVRAVVKKAALPSYISYTMALEWRSEV